MLALTQTELLGSERLEFIIAKGLHHIIGYVSLGKSQLTLEELMDCMLPDESNDVRFLERQLGLGDEASAEDLALIEALSAKLELATAE